MADILGIDRRINKENPEYLALKTGVTLSTLLELAERKHIEATRGGCHHKYHYECDRVFGTLRGIGTNIKSKDAKQEWWKQSEISDYVRNVHERSQKSDKGEYP